MTTPSLRSLVPTLLVAMALAPAALPAQEPAPPPPDEVAPPEEVATPKVAPVLHYTELAARFFERIAAGETKAAVDGLYEGNPWVADFEESLADATGQLVALAGVLGAYHGHELLVEERLSERTVYLWYLAYYDRQPVSFQFLFYKPEESWRTQHFQYTKEVGALAQQLARDRLLKRSAAGDGEE